MRFSLQPGEMNWMDGLGQIKELTAGYSLLTGSIALNVCDFSAGIGHVIPCSLHTSGLSTGKGTSTPSMTP